MATQTLTAQERANLFALSTRQNYQMLTKETVHAGATSIQFSLPKARLLSNISLAVTATIKATHATATTLAVDYRQQFYRLIRRLSLDLNNGFSPFVISGEESYLYNLIHRNGDYLMKNGNDSDISMMNLPDELTVSSTGADNKIKFFIDLPVTTNPRDPIGLILLQNEQTNVNVVIDVANASDMFDSEQTGYTLELTELTVEPVAETFSIPANQNAYPDLSVLKLVNGRNDSMPSTGQQIIKLSTGTIYRKIIFQIVDENGKPMSYDDISSNLELVFNTADVNYSISPRLLHDLNTRDLGYDLPKGMFVFDFSSAGNITGFGGTRDFVDTEKLSEMWLRFSTTKKGKVKIVTECLARLS